MKDIYIQFKGKYDVKGESRDAEHKDWIEVSSWNHTIKQPKSATASTAGGHTAERCEHGDMILVKELDLTSPRVWEACSAGHTFDEVLIDFMRADGDKRVKYLNIKLKNVLIAMVTPNISGEGIPTETFALKYAAVEWTYTAQDIKGGQKGQKVGKWSLATNKAAFEA